MNPSPHDRAVAFVRRRYRRDPATAVAIVLAVLWAAWVIFYVLDHRHGAGWYLLAQDAISEIGAGVILVAGIVWLVGIASDDPA